MLRRPRSFHVIFPSSPSILICTRVCPGFSISTPRQPACHPSRHVAVPNADRHVQACLAVHLVRADDELRVRAAAAPRDLCLGVERADADLPGAHHLGRVADVVAVDLVGADDQQQLLGPEAVPEALGRQHGGGPDVGLGLPAGGDGDEAVLAHEVLARVGAEAVGGGEVGGAGRDGDGAPELVVGGGRQGQRGDAGLGLLQVGQHGEGHVAAGRLAADDDVGGAAVLQDQAEGGDGLGQLARVLALGHQRVLEEHGRGARDTGGRDGEGGRVEGHNEAAAAGKWSVF